ncbi:MAG: ABC transporter permease [Rhizobiaceae bacterium]|nr:ABC transporter permease [Rhizobiaceae bacterium]
MSGAASPIGRYWFGVSTQRYSRAMTLVLLTPLLVLLVVAFFWPILRFLSLSVLEPEPTLDNFRQLWAREFYTTIAIRTFRTALIVTAGTLLLAYPVAYLMSTLRGAWAGFVAAIVVLPLWISILVRTYVWTVFLGRNGIINSSAINLGLIDQPMTLLNTEFAVWLAMIQIQLPMMILPIYSSLRAIPPDLGMAAQSLGGSARDVFRHVTLPLSLPGVAAGCVLVFIISLGYFITPMLIGGPRSMMIATLITQQATKFLDWPLASALACVLMGVTLAMVIVFNRVLRLDRVMGAG